MISFTALLAVALAAPSSTVADKITTTSTGSLEPRLAASSWSGEFLQTDWTFSFSNTDDKVTGLWRKAGGKNWFPLKELVASDRTVSFSIESKPKVSFSLELDSTKPLLAGTATIDGVATVPFSATPVP